MIRLVVAFLVSFCFGATAGWAQAESSASVSVLHELFTPVDPAEIQDILHANRFGLKKTLYSATRHRIVKVNIDLLLGEDTFTVTPFDDLQRTAKRISLWAGNNVLKWNGEFIMPEMESELANMGNVIDQVRPQSTDIVKIALRDKLLGIHFGLTNWARITGVEKGSATEPVREVMIEATRPGPNRNSETPATWHGPPVDSVSATIGYYDPRDDRMQVIHVSNLIPGYYVVWELDLEKTIHYPDDPDMEEKVQRYNTFLEAIEREREAAESAEVKL